MAEIVVGLGTSHTNMMSSRPEFWAAQGANDRRHKELISPRSHTIKTYDELLAERGDELAPRVTLEHFTGQYEQLQRGVNGVAETLGEYAPDTLVIITDDQDEILFEDNMPTFWIYWGESMRLIPRDLREDAPEYSRRSMWGWGDVEMDVSVDTGLAKHLIDSLMDADFDVAHARYMHETYGGSIGPDGYVWWKRETPTRRQGMPHGFSYPVRRVMENRPLPIVPILQNTCYPPNQPRPRRCYAFGQAIRAAIEAWDSPKRVAIMASGGLSHFVLDEETDHMVLDAIKNKDAETLCSFPTERLNSASSEIRNWITTAGACEHLDFEVIEYVPVTRSPAGTGGGWGFARWT